MKYLNENVKINPKLNKLIKKNLHYKKNFFSKYKNFHRNSACKICNSKKIKSIGKHFRNFLFYDIDLDAPIEEITFTRRLINLFRSDLQSVKPKKYYNNIRYCINNEQLIYCENCGLVFAEISYPYEFYLDLLTNMHDQSDPINYSDDLLEIDKKWALDKHLARINFLNKHENLNKQNLKFLEISSYRGWGLEYSKNDFDVYGIEAHEQSADFSKKRFSDLKNKIDYNLFECSNEFISKNKKFDVILLSQAFRHMKDPYNSLKLLSEIINNNGYVIIDESLFLDTILEEYFDRKKSQEYLGTIFNHGKAFYYSKNHLKYLFARHGFEFIKYEKYNSPNIEYIEEDLMLFKKTKDPQDIDFNTFNSKKYPMFESIQNIYVENKEQTERYSIEY